jgi:hypothetical protein
MCESLLEREEENGSTHKQKMDTMRHQFPRVKRCLDWWTAADVSAMLFPSRRAMLDDSPDDGIPDTTNAQESMHRLHYMISYVNFLLFLQLFIFVLLTSLGFAHINVWCKYTVRGRNP